MRRYETIFILDPDLSDDQRDSVFERVTDLIPRHDGLLVVLDKWGTKKLAYEIKKKPRGYYVRLDFCGNGHLVDEIERFFRIDDRVLKYMTILMEKAVDIEKIKEEMVQAEVADEQLAEDVEVATEQNLSEVPEPQTAEAEQNLSEVPEPQTAQTEIDQIEDNREA
jgi:small subunit ribosomal protein S6